MTLFAPHDLPLDDLLKLENRLRDMSSLQPRSADVLASDRSASDAARAVAPETVEAANGVSERMLRELEQLAARSARREPSAQQSLGSRMLRKFRPDR